MSVLPSFHLSFSLPGCFLGIVSLVFSKFWHGARNPSVTEPEFSEKNFLPQKLGKWIKNEPKTGFFSFTEKLGHYFLLNLFYNENLYYLLCSCTNPIFGKTFVPEIWAKMRSVNQIARFFNHPYLQNKLMKQPDIFCMLI